jgi:NADH-ubiquinone oxidoreductase chain 6
MIFSTQPITRLALLITVFIKSAFILILLDYTFLGLTYIIVYVGAIAILFLFVIMMAETHITPNTSNIITETPLILDMKETGPRNLKKNIKNSKEFDNNNIIVLLSLIIGIFLYFNFFNLFKLFEQDIWTYYTLNFSSEFFTFTDIQSLGFLLYLAYPFIIIILGLILWCVLVGILRISLA